LLNDEEDDMEERGSDEGEAINRKRGSHLWLIEEDLLIAVYVE